MKDPFSLAGRRALVTGGASGVTQAIARALAQAGADVAVTGPAEAAGAAQLDAAERVHGSIAILVNIAGRLDAADGWRAAFGASLDAPWRLAQEAARRMVERGGGKIVNVASPPAAHGASRDALVGFTKALANEFAVRSVNVNGIVPGDFAADVGGACVFLCSRAADSIHGHVLAVGGGCLAR
ncbi:SDR family NAD(P)-dependent oxidoreductase [Massilia putida]|uniref:SDR family NAD(P)-dependent oxidoreductase n=1 Tax=Massilia putida TaxID=1141883 RepID=UPI0009518394|nr:SDR family NAD(P)-dependent oxidoreductase [Massilia putida]